jgi:hypothetical protein
VTTRGLNLKRRLRAGEVTIGAWISFAESAVAEIMAGTGFDWILIDTEHAPVQPRGAADRPHGVQRPGVRADRPRALEQPCPSPKPHPAAQRLILRY